MISRSKSAPKSLNDLVPPATGRPSRLSRSRTVLSFNAPAATPWEAREDPFSLIGFFPSRPADSKEDWDWIYFPQDEFDEDDEGDLCSFSTPSQLDNKQGNNYDELAQQVIDGEDKFGMLAFSSENFPSLLRSKMPMFQRPISPVHVSPLAMDEPLDLDALHTKHCSRRETLTNTEAERVRGPEIGQLFFSREEERKDARSWPWMQAVYAQLASLVGGL